MKPSCWICKHYCQTSTLVTDGTRNLSGNLVKFRKWSKHRCALKQEDKYPRDCDFKRNDKLWKELEERYPDLAAAHIKVENGARRVAEIKRKIDVARVGDKE